MNKKKPGMYVLYLITKNTFSLALLMWVRGKVSGQSVEIKIQQQGFSEEP